ncbi:hypothetical protein CI610_03588 [invertebrate metagenome]|uniref:Uncharacterized protein n=1 Tax=invertebrate metagenome TaxID=1711999 RepID=A0A2H9T2N2_9ZZZZ
MDLYRSPGSTANLQLIEVISTDTMLIQITTLFKYQSKLGLFMSIYFLVLHSSILLA